ncbi:MAG: DeoR/GlpR transcriptional regulator, partial [Chloroflexi bacterium]|nr:DeoR/GlpR transcriptional regulator [Chloroflexota bacterium]
MTKLVPFNNPRLAHIERFIVQRQQVSVTDICEVFGISEATARRDLDQLASVGSIQRIHGGAIAINDAPPEPPVLQRSSWQHGEKQRIGELAATLIDAGDTVFISSGTTSLAVAQALRERNDLMIVTNSLPVMNLMADSGNAMIALGGMLRASESSFIGHLAVQGLAELRITKII